MTARIYSTIVVAVTLLLFAHPLLSAAELAPVAMENEFIRVVANPGPDEAGRFSIRTTGGDPSRPSSKNQHLIFGGNAPWTSYTTLLIDGTPYVFGGPTQRRAGKSAQYGQQVTPPSVTGDKITCSYQYGDVLVTQELSFVRGLSTRVLDTVGVSYKLSNHGTAAHQVGLRIMLDTMCGSNDGAPFRVGAQAITTATTLAGHEVPDYWQAFDSLTTPTVVCQGSLRGGGDITPPDKVVLADWGTLADDTWDPTLTAGQGFIRKGETELDTAAALFWNPVAVDAGQSTTYLTYFGIGDVRMKAGNLTLGLTAPAESTFAHERTESFTVTGYLQNAGGFPARGVALTLTLPEGLSLVNGSTLQDNFDNFQPNDTRQESWVLRPNGKKGGTLDLKLAVTSTNLEDNAVERAIQVDVPSQQLQFTPATQRVPLITNEMPTMIPIQVNLSPAENFRGMRLVVKYNPAVIRPLGEPFSALRGRAFTENGKLLEWSFDDSVDGTLIITGHRNNAVPITQAEANLAIIKFLAVGAGKSELSFEKSVLFGEKGDEIPVATATGAIEVTP